MVLIPGGWRCKSGHSDRSREGRRPAGRLNPSVNGPNPLRVLWNVLRARRVSVPRPTGSAVFDQQPLDAVLHDLAAEGIDSLVGHRAQLQEFRDRAEQVDPDELTSDEALGYWLNLYNGLVLDLVRRTTDAGHQSVLEVTGGFSGTVVRVAGEALSLDDIEHGKIRRFRDPRIHGALVCGSLSCPTLRHEAFRGVVLGHQLDDQMRHFVKSGAVVADRGSGVVHLSRVFLWYGADFARPNRMPAMLPARPRRVLESLFAWMDPDLQAWVRETQPKIEFQSYDWALGCSVRPPSANG